MANKIQGLTLTIGADTTALTTALKDVNKNTKDLQSELKDVEKLLKLDPTNTELLTQKQDLLTKSVENTKDKLDKLRTAAAQAKEQFDKGEITQSQYQALQREVVKTEQELKKLEKAASESNETLSKISATANKVSEGAGKVADATKKLSTAAAAGLAAIGGSSVKLASDYEDSLAKVSTIADTSVKSIGELSNEVLKVSNDTGTAASEINEALYQAISAGADTAKATNLVETAVKAAKGGFTDTLTAVDGLTSVLNTYNMATTDADSLANKFLITQNKGKTTFGELATSIGNVAPTAAAAKVPVNDLLSGVASLTANGIKTSEAMAGLKATLSNIIKPSQTASDTAEQLGLDFSTTALQSKGLAGFLADVRDKTGGNIDTMAQLFGSVEALNTVLTLTSDSGMSLLNDTMSEMQTNTTALDDAFNKINSTTSQQFAKNLNELKNAGIELGNSLMPLITELLSAMKSFAGWISSMDTDTQKMILVILAVVAAISPLARAIQGVSDMVKFMSLKGIPALSSAFSFLAANPIILVVAGIAALIAVLAHLFNTNQEFHDKVIEIWNGIKDFFTETIPEIINNIVQWFSELPGKIGAAVSGVLTSLSEWVTNVITWVGEAIPQVIESVVNFFAELPNKIAYAIGFVIGTLIKWHLDIINWVITEVPKIIDSILKFFTELPGKIYNAIIVLISKLVEWYQNVANWIKTEVPKIINSVVTFFSELPTKIYDAISGVIGKITQWKNDMVNKVKLEIPKVITSITDFFTELPGKMLDIGKNIVSGLMDGINSKIQDMKDTVGSFVQGVKDGFTGKSAFDTHSPSKWSKKIGEFVADGFGIGFTDKINSVMSSIQSSTSSLKTTVGKNLISSLSDTIGTAVDSIKTGLSNIKTVVTDDFANKLSYSAASASDISNDVSTSDSNQITAEDIANIISLALLEGLTYVGDRIFDALPKGVTMNLDGAKFATATWDSYDDIANKKRRIFSPSRNEIYDIALQAARSITG